MKGRQAVCHPARTVKAHGMCDPCYRGTHPRSPRKATCHPEHRAFGRGLCRRCYRQRWEATSKRAECHPERSRYTKEGLCGQCYARNRYMTNADFRKRRAHSKLKAALKSRNVSEQEYRNLLAAQGGVCAICTSSPKAGRRRLCIDHCHETGRVRGLLCDRCNRGIGLLRDNVSVLARAIEYLKTSSSPADTNVPEYGLIGRGCE
jgi:hypothetical protein